MQVDSFRVDEYGPLFDREWVVADESLKFITQRNFPQMAQIEPEVSSDHLALRIGEKRVVVPFESPQDRNVLEVEVWGHWLRARDEGEEAANFLSEFLGSKVRLFRFLREPQRPVGTEFISQTRFTDKFPFHIIYRSLVDDLQMQIKEQKILAESFRANVVLSGPLINEEEIKSLRLGELVLREGLPTSRCIITTLDHRSGVKQGPEPLALLSKLRRRQNKVYFGMHYVHEGNGIVHVGDAVTLL